MRDPLKGVIMNKVYEYRVLNRLTQQQLADAIGVSKQTILTIEKGNYSPSLTLSFKIAQFFNDDINNLFSYVREDSKG